MALTILTGSSQAAGINYSFRTSGSADWASVPTASYFYDIVDKLPRFKASNGDIQNIITFPFSGSAVITGSLNVTAGITGSLQGTASYATNALSASYAPSTPAFPYTGSALITGSLGITGSLSNGDGNIASGIFSHAEGDSTISSGSNSHAEGASTISYGLFSHAEGLFSQAIGEGSHAEGYDTRATAYQSHAEGQASQATGNYSHAEGNTTISLGDHSHSEGQNTITSGSYSHAEGNSTTATGVASHAEGNSTTSTGYASHAEGTGTQTGTQTAWDSGISSGIVTISSSYGNVSGSFAVNGKLLIYDEPFDYFYGKITTQISQSLFNGTNTIIKLYDTSITTTQAYVGDITQGIQNWTGNQTIPGIFSHAEGGDTISIGNFSHAEGYLTRAIGNSSHAEGVSTQAIGDYSHAEGEAVQAIGGASHAEGFNTIAAGNYQHVQGQYNISSSSPSAFILGNGTADNARSNLIFASGSQVQITGSVIATSGFTGSLQGTASYATNVLSASYATTASYSNTSTSASYAITASYALNALSASYALNGGVTQLLAGPNISLSPTNGTGQVTVSSTPSGGGFNTATGSYGSFYDTTIQTNVASTARSMSLNTTDITNGVSISGSTNPFNTYIKVANAGVYDIQFSAQVDKTDSGTDEIWIWIRKNGTDISDSATSVQLQGNGAHYVAAWNFFVNAAAGDYFQLMWYSPDANVRLHAESAFGVVPGIPSLIVTANRVDQFLSNTGSFSGSFTGTLTGTASYATNALSASYAPPAFPFTGSAGITGSLTVVGKTQSTQIGAGAAPSGSVPLDVRAQGALSTDIAFRVRNSADTANLLTVQGNGLNVIGDIDVAYTPTTEKFLVTGLRNTNVIAKMYGGSTGTPSTTEFQIAGINTPNISIGTTYGAPSDRFSSAAQIQVSNTLTNLVFGNFGTNTRGWGFYYTTAGGVTTENQVVTQITRFGSLSLGNTDAREFTDTNTLIIKNGIPSASIANSFKLYSSASVSGNAAPHFRTENGNIVKLYTQAAVTSSQGIADALTNLGFLTGSSVIASTSAFPYTGSAGITGSLTVVGPTTSTRIGAGAAPSGSVPLDVRAQGALYSDIAFRVRNSADSVDLFNHRGDGYITWRNNAGNKFMYWDADTLLQIGTAGAQTLSLSADNTGVSKVATTSDAMWLGSTTHTFLSYKNGNFQLEETSGIIQTSGAGGLSLKNAVTIPSINTIDRFTMYSADITAGNAAPHFRTENGNVVKIYQQTASVAIDTLLTNTGLRATGGNANFDTPITSSIILNGTSSAPSLNTTAKVTTIVGSNTIYSIPAASYDGAWFEYTVRSGSNARAGQIMSIWSGSSVNFTETTTTDFGTTAGIAFTVMVSGSNLILTGSSATAGWTVKTIVRSI